MCVTLGTPEQGKTGNSSWTSLKAGILGNVRIVINDSTTQSPSPWSPQGAQPGAGSSIDSPLRSLPEQHFPFPSSERAACLFHASRLRSSSFLLQQSQEFPAVA